MFRIGDAQSLPVETSEGEDPRPPSPQVSLATTRGLPGTNRDQYVDPGVRHTQELGFTPCSTTPLLEPDSPVHLSVLTPPKLVAGCLRLVIGRTPRGLGILSGPMVVPSPSAPVPRSSCGPRSPTYPELYFPYDLTSAKGGYGLAHGCTGGTTWTYSHTSPTKETRPKVFGGVPGGVTPRRSRGPGSLPRTDKFYGSGHGFSGRVTVGLSPDSTDPGVRNGPGGRVRCLLRNYRVLVASTASYP